MPSPHDPEYKRFFNCLAYVMEDQLRDLCSRSMKDYVDYLTDVGVSKVQIKLIKYINNFDRFASSIFDALKCMKYYL